jgi:hypothetical protein
MRELVFHQFLTPDFYTTTNKTSLYGTSGTGSRHHTRRPDEPKTKNQVKMHSSQNQFEPRPDSIHDRPSRKKTTPVFPGRVLRTFFLCTSLNQDPTRSTIILQGKRPLPPFPGRVLRTFFLCTSCTCLYRTRHAVSNYQFLKCQNAQFRTPPHPSRIVRY